MYKNILNFKTFSFPLCTALAWLSYSHYSQSFNKESEQKKLTKTFIWGNGKYFAKPDSFIQFKNFEPKLINSFLGADKINLTKVFFGEFHEAGIDNENNAYIWTKHSLSSSCEDGVNDNERNEVVLLDGSKDVLQIAFTKGFVWTLRKNGQVYQWPITVKFDEEGDEIQELKIGETPRHISSLSNIKQIATGADHFIALTNNGEVWSMGDDTYGFY